MDIRELIATFALDHKHQRFETSLAIHADCFSWMERIPEPLSMR